MLVLTQQIHRPSLGTHTSTTIASGSTEIVDSVSDTILSNKWIVTVSDSIDAKICSYELLAINKFGASVSHCIYSVVGDRVPHNVDVIINGSNLELQINNTGLNPLLINIVRIETINQ